jgi:hypothetical protein
MKWVYILIGVVVAIPISVFGIMYAASELGGEVVTLQRAEADGQVSDVRIWIVDADGMSWIEHGAPDSHWITRLANEPKLTLSRAGQSVSYVAAPDHEAHEQYHQLRQEKYGVADNIVAVVTGRTDACPGVPVRLQLTQ